MANIWEKAKSILAGNLNSGLSYLITAAFLSQQHIKQCKLIVNIKKQVNIVVI